jgi:tight adherence protein C
MTLIMYVALTFTIFCIVALLMAPILLRDSPETQRVIEVVKTNRLDERKAVGGDQLRDQILAAAHALRVKLGFSENPQLAERFLTAGLRGKSTSDVFFAAQFLIPVLGLIAGSFIPDNTVFWCFALAVVGYMSPDFWLTWKTNKRKKKIQRSMPDAIDLLVICVDAGLGLDQALLRVGEELIISHPEINQEFTQVNLAQRAGQPRLEAWKTLSDRTKIEEFAQFVSMLNQTERFGTPIAKALARFSEELRTKRRQKAEEAATKTKIKIIFPLVLFIFPCIFIVLLAPAILSIAAGLKGMGN